MSTPSRYTVFTKPWPNLSLDELGAFVAQRGFDGVELPVRPGYQVDPGNAPRMLPFAAETLNKHGVDLVSVAGPGTEAMIRACGEAGRPILRIMVKIPPQTDYLSHIEQTQRGWDALLPVLEKSGVTLGVQNHKDRFLTHAMHLYHAANRYDPRRVGAVWDAAHNAVAGADPELALDVLGPHLCRVNLKNGLWERDGVDELGTTRWKSRWVAGHEGLCDWPRVAAEPDVKAVERLAVKDLGLAKRCFEAV